VSLTRNVTPSASERHGSARCHPTVTVSLHRNDLHVGLLLCMVDIHETEHNPTTGRH